MVAVMSYGVWRVIDKLQYMEFWISVFSFLDKCGALGAM
jgi:hypothetical protein